LREQDKFPVYWGGFGNMLRVWITCFVTRLPVVSMWMEFTGERGGIILFTLGSLIMLLNNLLHQLISISGE
jgi:hypothetical protein